MIEISDSRLEYGHAIKTGREDRFRKHTQSQLSQGRETLAITQPITDERVDKSLKGGTVTLTRGGLVTGRDKEGGKVVTAQVDMPSMMSQFGQDKPAVIQSPSNIYQQQAAKDKLMMGVMPVSGLILDEPKKIKQPNAS